MRGYVSRTLVQLSLMSLIRESAYNDKQGRCIQRSLARALTRTRPLTDEAKETCHVSYE